MSHCQIPPAGWYCTRKEGHEGPCAALPMPRDTQALAALAQDIAHALRNPHARPADQTAAVLAFNTAFQHRIVQASLAGERGREPEPVTGSISAERLEQLQALRDDVRRKLQGHEHATPNNRVLISFLRVECLLDEGDELQSALARLTQERDAAEERLANSLPVERVRAALQKLAAKAKDDYLDFMQNHDEDEGIESMLAANNMTVQVIAQELRIDLDAPTPDEADDEPQVAQGIPV